MFREVNEGKFDRSDETSKILSQEVNKLGDTSIKGNDKIAQVEPTADAAPASAAKDLPTSNKNFRETLGEQARASQETVLGQVQENIMAVTPEFVARMEASLNDGKPIQSLRMMLEFQGVSENPVKALSELSRIAMDIQKS